jgi:anti-sigma B factor antagonist
MHIWRTVNTDHRRHEPRRVQTLPLLLMRKGDPEMVSIELSARESEGHAVVALSGELDVAEAASVAASLAAVAASGCVIVDLEGLAYIDSSGLAALVLARQHARGAGFDLLLAAPQQQVLRMLAITRLLDIFIPASTKHPRGQRSCGPVDCREPAGLSADHHRRGGHGRCGRCGIRAWPCTSSSGTAV